MKHKPSSAFSLIELSIVILIIGILIAGVTQGSRLVGMAKLRGAQTLTKSAPVASIDGLMLWLEPTLDESFADGEADEGVNITQWKDTNPQNSFKYFAVNTNTVGPEPVGPVYKLSDGPNGLPSLLFDGNLLTLANDAAGVNLTAIVTEGNAFTYFIVSAIIDDSSDSYAISNTFWGYDVYPSDSDGNRFVYGGFPMEFSSRCGASVEVFSVASNGSGESVAAYVNGVAAANNGATGGGVNTGQNILYIGAYDNAATGPWIGYISEIIIFDHALKDEERQAVEQYLGQKYGIRVVQ
jgi:prepilin-type N-terminal cleavage/methylation domain-containing protein